MFKIAEELMQKIKEAVAINEPVLAVGNMSLMSGCHCVNVCQNNCGRACSGRCDNGCKISCR
ncbi:MAG: hypothetical protein NC177_15360 [Ruminococcus flavefaciens]|nr:hypothetical protein [Ruminococcus flavefaciens]